MNRQTLLLLLGITMASMALYAALTETGHTATAQGPKKEVKPVTAAKTYVAPKGFLESLPRVQGGKAKSPSPTEGYLYYENMPVNYSGGFTMNDSGGATQISVYANHIRWRFSGNSADILTPDGQGGPAGNGWQFPNANRFGIVVYQGGNYWNVTSTDPNNPTVITGVTNTTPLSVAVNDTNGNYGDNWGSFDFFLRRDN